MKMRANVFKGANKIGLEERPIPKAGPGEAVVKVTLTTICGTDVHIMKGEYPVKTGQTIGHEPVGVIQELGIADKKIVSTLCPGGKERMRRLISLVKNERVNLRQLITHRFSLDEIEEAYRIFSNQLDGVIKVTIKP